MSRRVGWSDCYWQVRRACALKSFIFILLLQTHVRASAVHTQLDSVHHFLSTHHHSCRLPRSDHVDRHRYGNWRWDAYRYQSTGYRKWIKEATADQIRGEQDESMNRDERNYKLCRIQWQSARCSDIYRPTKVYVVRIRQLLPKRQQL